MKYRIDTAIKTESRFIIEDYFPVILEFSAEELNNHFIEFKYKNTDMFEFAVHRETHAIKRFTLTLCNHYAIIEGNLSVPDSVDGALMLDGPDTNECKTFMVNVYSDGVLIKLSEENPSVYYRTGNLILALTENNELTDVYLVNLSKAESDHVKNELNLAVQ